jgi:hypothetical protein
MIPNDAFSGNKRKNPFKFDHNNLNYIALYMDGMQIPSIAYKPDFTNKLYMKEYLGLFESLNELSTDTTLILNKNQWANGNTIFGFNLSPDLADQCSKVGFLNLIKSGNLRVEMKFSQALSKTINVLLFCEYDNIIEIDQTRTPITNYI